MDTFLHTKWECPLVLPLWQKVLEKLDEWLGQNLHNCVSLETGLCCLQVLPGFGLVLAGFITAADLFYAIGRVHKG